MTRKTLQQSLTVGILLIVSITVALATVFPISGSEHGYWVSRFTPTSSAPNDTGVALFKYFSQADSRAIGLHFTGGSGALDTGIATWGATTPFYLFGSVASSGSALRYVQLTDTAQINLLTTSYSDSITAAAAATTWSNPLRGTTGTATDSFLYDTPNFGRAALTTVANDSSIRFFVASDKATDSARTVFIRPGGQIHDTYMIRTSGGGNGVETFSTPNVFVFEAGITRIFQFFWNSDSGKLQVKERTWFTGASQTFLTGGTGSAGSINLTANIRALSISVNSIGMANQAASVIIMASPSAPGSHNASDLYLTVDSNSSVIGFDTRFPNSVFDITVIDSTGATITKLPAGQKYLVTLTYAFNEIPLAKVQRAKLLHYNFASNSWDALTTTVTVDTSGNSGNAVAIAEVSEFSQFAFGTLSPGSEISNDDNNCLIASSASGTSAERGLPGLRSLRDAALESVIGRFLVGGYYSAMIILLALSLPLPLLAVARRTFRD